MLRRLVQNPALADDLHQETFVLVLGKIRGGEVREPERIAGFLRGTARNLFIADRRKEARYRSLDDGREAEEGGRPEVLIADRTPAPLDRVLADEEARQVRRLLDELRYDRDRQLLLRFYLSDDGKEEICADLGVEPERFHQVLFRARERLRELWERAEKRQRFFTGAQRIVGRIGGDRSPERIGQRDEHEAMDHQSIDSGNVAERYVTGRLAPEEAASFEEHYLDCPSCCARVEAAERLQRGLRRLAEESAVRPPGAARWSRSPRLALAAAALLAVGLVPAWTGTESDPEPALRSRRHARRRDRDAEAFSRISRKPGATSPPRPGSAPPSLRRSRRTASRRPASPSSG